MFIFSAQTTATPQQSADRFSADYWFGGIMKDSDAPQGNQEE